MNRSGSILNRVKQVLVARSKQRSSHCAMFHRFDSRPFPVRHYRTKQISLTIVKTPWYRSRTPTRPKLWRPLSSNSCIRRDPTTVHVVETTVSFIMLRELTQRAMTSLKLLPFKASTTSVGLQLGSHLLQCCPMIIRQWSSKTWSWIISVPRFIIPLKDRVDHF